MLKKTIILILLIFSTQTVLASFDFHSSVSSAATSTIENNSLSDIIKHYIDTHGANYHITYHYVTSTLNDDTNDSTRVNIQPIISLNEDLKSNLDSESVSHHHDCHGHATSFTFNAISFIDINYIQFYTHFFYSLSYFSIILNSPKRPPIIAIA
jgi:hypothetical protein